MADKKTSAKAMTDNDRKLPISKSKAKKYSVETLYQYYALAQGIIEDAIRLMKKEKLKQVPTWKTFNRYAQENDFEGRLKYEKEEEWKQFQEERESNVKVTLGKLAHALEEYAAFMSEELLSDVAKAKAGDAKAKARVHKYRFDSIDKFLRIYLRTHGMPEHITEQNTNLKHQDALSYDELEQEDATCESVEEARKQIPSAIQT